MNPALTPLSQIREMTNAELVAFAEEHSTLTILEREFLRRMKEMYTAKDSFTERSIDPPRPVRVGILNGAIVRSK